MTDLTLISFLFPSGDLHILWMHLSIPRQKSTVVQDAALRFRMQLPSMRERLAQVEPHANGVGPRGTFNPTRWKEEDKLKTDKIARPLKNPRDFFTSVCLLQEREREAKSPKGANFQALQQIYRERSEVMRVIKHPHFCHHKTNFRSWPCSGPCH